MLLSKSDIQKSAYQGNSYKLQNRLDKLPITVHRIGCTAMTTVSDANPGVEYTVTRTNEHGECIREAGQNVEVI